MITENTYFGLDENQIFDTSKLVVGYLAQVNAITYTLGDDKKLLNKFLNLERNIDTKIIKKTIFIKENTYQYIDLKTGIK